MPRRRSIAAWSKPLFLPSSDCHAFVQLRSLISLPLFCKVTIPLPVPPTQRDPLFLVFPRAPRSKFASSFARRTKLGRIIPKRLSGLSTLPPNWRRCNLIGQSSRPSSPPPTLGSLVSCPFRSIALSYFSDSFSDILFQSWSRRSKPSMSQPPPRPGR